MCQEQIKERLIFVVVLVGIFECRKNLNLLNFQISNFDKHYCFKFYCFSLQKVVH